ncbi:RelA/SpoT family protein [Desulfolucanica intricata]|uniref:RelA/SpoT family protein n=1 Tax=Desulfolucanica intricata TaxID=1285191 RepID=UPI0008363439|nr:bifunctional (p)ppGpp synthetase/guanosine-3',5'-bis(diphosphate) 3'-pyrophosphohydrolase [Desulfolucanica intricata]
MNKLVQKLISYNPNADLKFLRKAYNFAEAAHRHQLRISGEPFISHPLAVAKILADLELDLETLVGALLHDVVEDTEVTLSEIEKEFGPEVTLLVDGVTKLSRIEYKSKEEQQAENLRKMFLAMAKDIRVILIKLADRLHNLRTLKYHSELKQKEIAGETLEIFAPLAHRLGIYHLKWEIEDLAFRYLEPEKYYELADRVAKTRMKREEYIAEVTIVLQEKLNKAGITADIQGRPKHLYSIYEKMQKQQKDFEQIYDVMAVRVIVNSVKDCYGTLGIVHTLWKPIPGRFKDYIAMPKSNMYQSLHTTVLGPQGEPLEIQMRTWEMHRTAEYGIAAHWRYKAGGRSEKRFDEKFIWLRQLLEWQHDMRDPREFMETLKIDIFADSVFVFSPKGDVIELPAGSVPLDFAYRIHTDVGNHCVGAKINGRIVTLDYKLNNGDIVEVLTSKHTGPSRDWLKIVKTSQAKNRIRQWFRKEQRDEYIIRGKDALEREAKKMGLEPELIKGDKLIEGGRKYNLLAADDIYAAIGDGTITARSIVARIKRDFERTNKDYQGYSGNIDSINLESSSSWGKSTGGIRVKGIENLLIRLAHCCNPVPGDPIIGYITRGRGVSVHRTDCPNITVYRRGERERLVDVAWDKEFKSPFQVKLEVSALDRAGLLSDVMAILTEMKISADWVNARGKKDRLASIDLLITIKDLGQLEAIINRIKTIKDIIGVRRTGLG